MGFSVMRKIPLLIVSVTAAAIGFSASVVRIGSERTVAAEESVTTIKSAARKVNLNSASVRELERLPGIGPEAAERVVRHRPYHKLDELISRKILGRKEFARIKERVRVH
jgi:competence protein ComEA